MTPGHLYRCLLVLPLYYLQFTSQAKGVQEVQGYDCSDVWEHNKDSSSGIYAIKPEGANSSFPVFCEMSATRGWTQIQEHNGMDRLSFQKLWEDYENGFGNLEGEHWLGLKHIHLLTNQKHRPCTLHISIGDFLDNEAYAEYRPFHVGDANDFYRLSAGQYSGTAGDSFQGDITINGTNQHGSFFSTLDRPNDKCHKMCQFGDIVYPSCSYRHGAGWWFNACGLANLNGKWRQAPRHKLWASSVSWPSWRPYESLKFSKIYLIHNDWENISV